MWVGRCEVQSDFQVSLLRIFCLRAAHEIGRESVPEARRLCINLRMGTEPICIDASDPGGFPKIHRLAFPNDRVREALKFPALELLILGTFKVASVFLTKCYHTVS